MRDNSHQTQKHISEGRSERGKGFPKGEPKTQTKQNSLERKNNASLRNCFSPLFSSEKFCYSEPAKAPLSHQISKGIIAMFTICLKTTFGNRNFSSIFLDSRVDGKLSGGDPKRREKQPSCETRDNDTKGRESPEEIKNERKKTIFQIPKSTGKRKLRFFAII